MHKCYSNVKHFFVGCVSKVIMSPLTATLKCPHGDRDDTHGAEAVAEVAFDQDGGRDEDDPSGGRGEDEGLLPTSQAH